jgi:hypothetical protein
MIFWNIFQKNTKIHINNKVLLLSFEHWKKKVQGSIINFQNKFYVSLFQTADTLLFRITVSIHYLIFFKIIQLNWFWSPLWMKWNIDNHIVQPHKWFGYHILIQNLKEVIIDNNHQGRRKLNKIVETRYSKGSEHILVESS